MYAEITSGLAGIKTLSDLVSLALKLKVDAAVTEKAIESQAAIIALQSAILAVQAQNQSLLEENSRLKEEQVNAQSWERETQKYVLAEIGEYGGVAFTLKPEHSEGTPSHWLCPNCYEEKKKAPLQMTGETKAGRYLYVCSRCPTKIMR